MLRRESIIKLEPLRMLEPERQRRKVIGTTSTDEHRARYASEIRRICITFFDVRLRGMCRKIFTACGTMLSKLGHDLFFLRSSVKLVGARHGSRPLDAGYRWLARPNAESHRLQRRPSNDFLFPSPLSQILFIHSRQQTPADSPRRRRDVPLGASRHGQ